MKTFTIDGNDFNDYDGFASSNVCLLNPTRPDRCAIVVAERIVSI